MRSTGVAVVALLVGLLVAGRVLGDEKDRARRSDAPRPVLVASEDPCQWVTATLPYDPEAEATVFHGPFFLTYLAPGDPVSVLATAEGRDPVRLGELREVKDGTRIFIPANTYVVVGKSGQTGRLYSGFRPY